MKHALLLHAWYNTPENHWYPWLKKELQTKGYKVDMPELPTMNTALPDLAIQFKTAEKFITKDTVVIGHSLGAVLAMRLAEKYAFQKMICVAGWDFNELTTEHRLFWKKPINHESIKKNVKEIYVVSSDNDPYTAPATAEDMSKRFGGKFILIKGAGHFTKQYGVEKISEILNLV